MTEPTPRTVAAIDCGTNSTRLLVARFDDQGRPVALERLMRITRLGRGTDATGRLDPAAIDTTVEVLREYREVMDRFGVAADGRDVDGAPTIRMTATSAARDAANRDAFFDAAEAAVGVRPELLTGEQEGHLSFAGATADLDPADGPFLVVDIGGGSTEFSYGSTEAERSISLDIGCVRMTEKFLHEDPPAPAELSACLSVIEVHFNDVLREIPEARDARTLVGLAGTVSNAVAVEIGLPEYDRDRVHHFRLTKHAAEDVFRTLATEALDDRVHNPGLEEQRADVIVGGLCILVQLYRQFGFDSLVASESDILDGLAMSLAPTT